MKKRNKGPLEDDDEAAQDHYSQLWGITPDPEPPDPKSLLVWVEKTLALSRNFTTADCHPLASQTPSPTLPPATHITVSKALFAEICAMAELQGRGRGRGKGVNTRSNKQMAQGSGEHQEGQHSGQWFPQFDPQFGPPLQPYQYGSGFPGGQQIPPPWFPGPYFHPPPPMQNQWRGGLGWGAEQHQGSAGPPDGNFQG